jgi:uridine kinase
MIRDNRTRGHSVKTTIDLWPKVRRGEDKNIFPYNGEADVLFNSALLYELAVLKKHAEPLLREVTPLDNEYTDAIRLLDFLSFFLPITDETSIPGDSILREFVGGSEVV